MNFLKVWTELDDGKFKSLPAKIVKSNKNTLTIQYLSSTNKKTISGKRIYAYEEETYEITEDSIIQRVDSELSLGYEEVKSSPGNFVKFESSSYDADDDDDEDYIPSSSEEDDDDDEEESSDDEEDDEDDDEEEDISGDEEFTDEEEYELDDE